ncbi:hypothetical protein [Nostoc sp. FACHB-133]|uniref:hypothetical protein n=1 Tax=Nostoc sp. FACHB-133 TaxID=2692835 RepID=UPI001687A344|nr:hypothetical protein [Nostoc sp. FACHB-133]MBD2521403.1 hypothetical protein [Nostoc sp. FACHB-133]
MQPSIWRSLPAGGHAIAKKVIHKNEQRIRLTCIEFSLLEKLRESFRKDFFNG